MLPKHSYFEVAVILKPSGEQNHARVIEFLNARKIERQRIVTEVRKTLEKICFYTRSSGEVRKVTAGFPWKEERGIRLGVRLLGRADWRDKWKTGYHTSPLGRRFWIVPVWEARRTLLGKRSAILLDPEGAFGSGTHDSTRLAVLLMERVAGKFDSFLDIGTGTGILAVVAAKLGAQKVLGIDNDGGSVRTAARNFSRNRCRGGKFIRRDFMRWRFGKTYDLVVANLISKSLTAFREKIREAVCPGGSLITSGIHRSNLSDFLLRFRQPGLRCLKVQRTRGWVAILWKRAGRKRE
jgi:ribosomal protein L11 methyltransferase